LNEEEKVRRAPGERTDGGRYYCACASLAQVRCHCRPLLSRAKYAAPEEAAPQLFTSTLRLCRSVERLVRAEEGGTDIVPRLA
jgi:hypothetical protein